MVRFMNFFSKKRFGCPRTSLSSSRNNPRKMLWYKSLKMGPESSFGKIVFPSGETGMAQTRGLGNLSGFWDEKNSLNPCPSSTGVGSHPANFLSRWAFNLRVISPTQKPIELARRNPLDTSFAWRPHASFSCFSWSAWITPTSRRRIRNGRILRTKTSKTRRRLVFMI